MYEWSPQLSSMIRLLVKPLSHKSGAVRLRPRRSAIQNPSRVNDASKWEFPPALVNIFVKNTCQVLLHSTSQYPVLHGQKTYEFWTVILNCFLQLFFGLKFSGPKALKLQYSSFNVLTYTVHTVYYCFYTCL